MSLRSTSSQSTKRVSLLKYGTEHSPSSSNFLPKMYPASVSLAQRQGRNCRRCSGIVTTIRGSLSAAPDFISMLIPSIVKSKFSIGGGSICRPSILSKTGLAWSKIMVHGTDDILCSFRAELKRCPLGPDLAVERLVATKEAVEEGTYSAPDSMLLFLFVGLDDVVSCDVEQTPAAIMLAPFQVRSNYATFNGIAIVLTFPDAIQRFGCKVPLVVK